MLPLAVAAVRKKRKKQAPATVYKNPVAVDTFNKFGVGGTSDGKIVILNAPLQAMHRPGAGLPDWPAIAPLSPGEALNLAAWIVAITGRRFEFNAVLDEIQAT